VQTEVDAGVNFAMQAAYPTADEVKQDIYA
jgi:hypothetical protein